MASTTSRPLTTFPKSAYAGGRRTPSGPLIKKNCEPLVFGHCERTDFVLTGLGQLVVEAISRTAAAGSRRVASLAHESLDDAVEDHSVVIVIQGEEDEAVDSARSLDRVEGDHQRSHRGLHRRRVALGRVDAHLGLLFERLALGS
jgi:hypothetical protein